MVYNRGDMNATSVTPAATGPAEYKECFKCSFRGETDRESCPQCGKKLRTSKNIRVRGVIQIVTGVILVLMMAALSFFIGVLVTKGAADPETAKKMADQRSFLLTVYLLFGVLALFGLNGIVMGTWQAITGRRNKVLMWIMFVLLALILIACFATVFVVK
jgi:cytochrome bd-type quinol oxidase subunit 2